MLGIHHTLYLDALELLKLSQNDFLGTSGSSVIHPRSRSTEVELRDLSTVESPLPVSRIRDSPKINNLNLMSTCSGRTWELLEIPVVVETSNGSTSPA